MSKLARVKQKLFGSTALSTEIGKFGSLAAGTPTTTTDPTVMQSLANWNGGWNAAILGGNSPAIEDMNAVHYVYAYQLGYLFQQGIPEYNSTTDYYIGSLVQDGTGILYRSIYGAGITPNTGNALSNATYWEKGISNNSILDATIQNAKLATMANQTIKGNVSGSSAVPIDLSAQQVRTMVYAAPTIQKFTSGSGTYTTPANVKYIRVRMVGGGGGGGGSNSSGGGGGGGVGGDTTFGTSLLTCTGGSGGGVPPSGGAGGSGGTATLSSPAIGQFVNGGSGGGGVIGPGGTQAVGGFGAPTPFGGNGSGTENSSGTSAVSNSGSGGGGSTYGSGGFGGGGGGAGAFINAIITAPSATYSYSIGTGGTGGSGAYTGGTGGSGAIIVEEFYL